MATIPTATVEAFDRQCRAAGGRLPCFCFGSNSAVQVRERVVNPFLTPERARVRGYRRVYAGYSRSWGGGGVASIVPVPVGATAAARQNPHLEQTLGSVIYLSPSEFETLDRFEGIPDGVDPFSTDARSNVYRREWVHVEIGGDGDDDNVRETAVVVALGIAFVRNDLTWKGYPSDRYLAACTRNIGQFWPRQLEAGLPVCV